MSVVTMKQFAVSSQQSFTDLQGPSAQASESNRMATATISLFFSSGKQIPNLAWDTEKELGWQTASAQWSDLSPHL